MNSRRIASAVSSRTCCNLRSSSACSNCCALSICSFSCNCFATILIASASCSSRCSCCSRASAASVSRCQRSCSRAEISAQCCSSSWRYNLSSAWLLNARAYVRRAVKTRIQRLIMFAALFVDITTVHLTSVTPISNTGSLFI